MNSIPEGFGGEPVPLKRPQSDGTPTLLQRINAVCKEVKNVAKDIEVRSGGTYKAVSHDAVNTALRGLFAEHGIIRYPTLVESSLEDTGQRSQNGNPMMRYAAKYDVRYLSVDDPSDCLTIRSEAHALDFGDKAPGKAQSYAVKYSDLKLFMIVTGENDEERPEAEAVVTMSKIAVTKTIKALDAAFKADDGPGAIQVWDELTNDQKQYLWSQMDRARKNELSPFLKEAQKAADEEPAPEPVLENV